VAPFAGHHLAKAVIELEAHRLVVRRDDHQPLGLA
jgi:hypothetical protein